MSQIIALRKIRDSLVLVHQQSSTAPCPQAFLSNLVSISLLLVPDMIWTPLSIKLMLGELSLSVACSVKLQKGQERKGRDKGEKIKSKDRS